MLYFSKFLVYSVICNYNIYNKVVYFIFKSIKLYKFVIYFHICYIFNVYIFNDIINHDEQYISNKLISNFEDIKMDRTIQSVIEENASTSSYHKSTNKQPFLNQDQQR